VSQSETIITEEIGHSPLGASGASRWMKCPGSYNLIRRLGLSSTAGKAAEQGTAAHEVIAKCLQSVDLEPMDFFGKTIEVNKNKYKVDQEMVDALDMCFNHVQTTIADISAQGEIRKFIEVSMKHSEYELMYGTVDCGLVLLRPHTKKVRIWICDLKYGAGVMVEAHTPQIKYYGVLIVDKLIQERMIDSFDDVEDITLTIMQPRIPHPDGLIRSITLTGAELEQWFTEELVPAYEAVFDENAILRVGDQCTFCPAKEGKCPAMNAAIVEISTAKAPHEMSGEELAQALEKIKIIAKMQEKFEKEIFNRLRAGAKVPGWKVVQKKANRIWRKEAEFFLYEEYGDAAYNTSLKTPAMMEDLPDGKKFAAQYAYSPDAGLTLAPSSDKRVEVKSSLELFDELEDGVDV